MTTLRCTCGTLIEGTGGQLLQAVERHLQSWHTELLEHARDHVEQQPRSSPVRTRTAVSYARTETKGTPR
jgi:hypothetical protein